MSTNPLWLCPCTLPPAPLWRPVCDLLFEFSTARCGHQASFLLSLLCSLLPKGGVNFTVCARFDPSLKVVAAQTEHPLALRLCPCLVVVAAHLVALLCFVVLFWSAHFSRRCVAAIFNLLQLYGRASATTQILFYLPVVGLPPPLPSLLPGYKTFSCCELHSSTK